MYIYYIHTQMYIICIYTYTHICTQTYRAVKSVTVGGSHECSKSKTNVPNGFVN